MENKDIIPLEQLIGLKKIGFSCPEPIGEYQGGRVFYYENGSLYYDGRPMYSSDAHDGQMLAATFSQAFRWFRNRGFLIDLSSHDKDTHEFYLKWSPNKSILSNIYSTYEEAELACLDKLIEIGESKQPDEAFCTCIDGVIICPGCDGEKQSQFGVCAGCDGVGMVTCGKCGGKN